MSVLYIDLKSGGVIIIVYKNDVTAVRQKIRALKAV